MAINYTRLFDDQYLFNLLWLEHQPLSAEEFREPLSRLLNFRCQFFAKSRQHILSSSLSPDTYRDLTDTAFNMANLSHSSPFIIRLATAMIFSMLTDNSSVSFLGQRIFS